MPINRQRITHNRSARSALILGITGQDGSYLAEHLLNLGYEVHGLVRRSSMFNRSRIEHLRAAAGGKSLTLHYSDLTDHTSLRRIIQKVGPREIYHLAGQSHVGLSFEIPEVTCQENANATLALLEILRDLDYPVRFYHAASSELFGAPDTAPQNESTPINPVNPYGCAKAYATQMCRVYRSAYGLFAVNGIAYNHESPRRGENFVTRKITLSLARIKAGLQPTLRIGNLDAKRDWGFAGDYVAAMWLMQQQAEPDDYVIATGETRTVRDFIDAAAPYAGFDIVWEGEGVKEVGRDRKSGKAVVEVDPRYFRPAEVDLLLGDPRKAEQVLGWKPRVSFLRLVELMMKADLQGIVK